jgi:hypothetical protein
MHASSLATTAYFTSPKHNTHHSNALNQALKKACAITHIRPSCISIHGNQRLLAVTASCRQQTGLDFKP